MTTIVIMDLSSIVIEGREYFWNVEVAVEIVEAEVY